MDVIPLFASDHSVCDSILTLSKDIYQKIEEEKDGKKVVRQTEEVEIKENLPVSMFAIAKLHSVDPLVVVESSMSSYWEIYKIAKSFKIPFVFGLKLCVCDDLNIKNEDSLKTESNVVIFCRNSQAYYDLIKISSQAHLEGFYKQPRTSWEALSKLWTPNLELAVPFYSSFLARNLMYFGHGAFPLLEKLGRPTFFRESHGLPFDSMINGTLEKFCKVNNFEIQDAHSIYYYKDADAIFYQALKCIGNRSYLASTLQKPNLDNFGSDKFSFEEYSRRIGKPI